MANKKELRNFYVNLSALLLYKEQHGGFPTKQGNYKLYSWMASIRNLMNKNLLRDEYVTALDHIGFVWSKRDLNWFLKSEEARAFVATHGRAPKPGDDLGLYQWLKTNLDLLTNGSLEGEKKERMQLLSTEIIEVGSMALAGTRVKITGKELNWKPKYEALVAFRREHPDRWPVVETPDLAEKKLGIWCQDLRSRARKGILEQEWQNKLALIGFNFDGRRGNWMTRFRKLERACRNRLEVPERILAWAKLQYAKIHELDAEREQLLRDLGADRLFTRADDFPEKLAACAEVIGHEGSVDRDRHPELHKWLAKQRLAHRKGQLEQARFEALQNAGIQMRAMKHEDVWEQRYAELQAFRQANPDRWPSPLGNRQERKLYLWCQAQRQVHAGTARNRKPLSAERVEKLNAIGFHWSAQTRRSLDWEERYHQLQRALALAGPDGLSPYANPSLYHWYHRQKRQLEAGRLEAERAERLIMIY